MLLAVSKMMLQTMIDEFNKMHKRRELKINVGNGAERTMEQTIHFEEPNIVVVHLVWGGRIEEVVEFKYLGIVLCKNGGKKGKIRGKTEKDRQEIVSWRAMRSVSMSIVNV